MRKTTVRLSLVVVAAVASAALLPIVVASRDSGAKAREITVVAKGMTFYVDGDTSPNPTLRVKAGEQIRLVLRNEDPGMTHDFVVKDWKISTKTLAVKGDQDIVEFRVPPQRGDTAYQCTPHAQMMNGRIRIE